MASGRLVDSEISILDCLLLQLVLCQQVKTEKKFWNTGTRSVDSGVPLWIYKFTVKSIWLMNGLGKSV